MEAPLVNVVVICYNHEFYISDCLKSIIEQSYTNLKIFVIDDGSKDNSQNIIKQFALTESRIVPVLLEKNGGIAKAFNLGLSLLDGKYVCNYAGDDIMLPDKIKMQVDALENNPDYEACFHDVEVFDSDTGKILYRWLDRFLPTRNVQDALFNTNWFFKKIERKTPSASWFAKVDYWKHGENDSRTSAHHEFIMGIGFLQNRPLARWYTIPEVLGMYRTHGNNLSRQKKSWMTSAEELGVACGIAKVRCPEYYKQIHNYEAFWWFKNLLYDWITPEYKKAYLSYFIKEFGVIKYFYLVLCKLLLSKKLIRIRHILKSAVAMKMKIEKTDPA